jgi:hypothetical protein
LICLADSFENDCGFCWSVRASFFVIAPRRCWAAKESAFTASVIIEPDDTSVIALESTARHKATVVGREHKRFEKRAIVPVERNVEEHPIAVAWRQSEPQTDLDLPLLLEDFDDSDLAETVTVFFLDRLALGFEVFFRLRAFGSTVAGLKWNPKYERRPILNEPVEKRTFATPFLELPLRAFANRAAPRAFVCEIVPVFEAAIIARCSIAGPSIQRLNVKLVTSANVPASRDDTEQVLHGSSPRFRPPARIHLPQNGTRVRARSSVRRRGGA